MAALPGTMPAAATPPATDSRPAAATVAPEGPATAAPAGSGPTTVGLPEPDPALAALLASLRRQPPVSDAFHELRYRRALRAPLQVSGELAWHGDMAFVREVRQPYREHLAPAGRRLVQQRRRRRRAPRAAAPCPGTACFSKAWQPCSPAMPGLRRCSGCAAAAAPMPGPGADAAGAADAGNGADNGAWRLDLAPRDAGLRQRVPALSFHGRGHQARCLVLHQRNAQTLIVLERNPCRRHRLPPRDGRPATPPCRRASISCARCRRCRDARRRPHEQRCPARPAARAARVRGATASGTGRPGCPRRLAACGAARHTATGPPPAGQETPPATP